MPAGLFSLYIRNMALYEKNPTNSKYERIMFWLFKFLGVVSIVGGAYGLYIYVPDALYVSVATSKAVYNGWAILNIGKKIAVIIFGIGILVCYKKSIHIFIRLWIIVPFIIFLILTMLIKYFYYWPTLLSKIWFEVLGLIFYIGVWFYFRKKYPEEFGLKS